MGITAFEKVMDNMTSINFSSPASTMTIRAVLLDVLILSGASSEEATVLRPSAESAPNQAD